MPDNYIRTSVFMDIFNSPGNANQNLLPYDGILKYFGRILDKQAADTYLQKLLTDVDWRHDEVIMFGKKIVTARKVAWYGEQPFRYTYSNSSKLALPWTGELRMLKEITERISGESYNCCLLNLYHNGSEAMSWHSDNERELKRHGAIASLSFGAERKFSFKHRTSGERIDIQLEHGSLLLMAGTTQSHWLHRLPPSKRILTPRVNLTFRTITENGEA